MQPPIVPEMVKGVAIGSQEGGCKGWSIDPGWHPDASSQADPAAGTVTLSTWGQDGSGQTPLPAGTLCPLPRYRGGWSR